MSPEPYARALWKMLQDGVEPKKAVAGIVKVLERQGRRALISRVGRAFERLAERESRKSALTLSVARKGDERSARRELTMYLREMGVKADDVSVALDDSLIGGWRLEGRERLVDASFKKHLLSLYNRSTQ